MGHDATQCAQTIAISLVIIQRPLFEQTRRAQKHTKQINHMQNTTQESWLYAQVTSRGKYFFPT